MKFWRRIERARTDGALSGLTFAQGMGTSPTLIMSLPFVAQALRGFTGVRRSVT
jgi:hypothetical protein